MLGPGARRGPSRPTRPARASSRGPNATASILRAGFAPEPAQGGAAPLSRNPWADALGAQPPSPPVREVPRARSPSPVVPLPRARPPVSRGLGMALGAGVLALTAAAILHDRTDGLDGLALVALVLGVGAAWRAERARPGAAPRQRPALPRRLRARAGRHRPAGLRRPDPGAPTRPSAARRATRPRTSAASRCHQPRRRRPARRRARRPGRAALRPPRRLDGLGAVAALAARGPARPRRSATSPTPWTSPGARSPSASCAGTPSTTR